MHTQNGDINEIIKSLRDHKDWTIEIRNLELLMSQLSALKKVTSVRELAKLIDKSKSWVAVSIDLIKGLKIYPEIEKCSNRNEAYTFLMKKKKLRRFLES